MPIPPAPPLPPAPTSSSIPPPPPPPPLMPGFGGKSLSLALSLILHRSRSAPLQLPQYLRKKQKYHVNEPIKKVQWSKVGASMVNGGEHILFV